MTGAAAAKQALRLEMLARLRAVSPEARARESLEIVTQVLMSPHWLRARCVMLFAPMPEEPDLMPLIPAAGGRRLCFPMVEPDGTMTARETHILTPGRWRVPEPPPEAAVVDPSEIDLVLVPGLAFTMAGDRMGRGRGHYDRFLGNTSAVRIGIALSCQVVDALPVEAHDFPLEGIMQGGASPYR